MVLAGVGSLVLGDWVTWTGLAAEDRNWATALYGLSSPPFLAWLALLPVCWLYRSRSRDELEPSRAGWLSAVGCGLVALGVAVFFGWPIRHLPPLYHDEHAYLFQARTFLNGHLHYPGNGPLADAFRQMHVLDGAVFAGRYFPGTALWLLPFLAAGLPVAGWWLAHGLTAALVARIAGRWGTAAAWTAGLSLATTPALAVFGNLLLSPTPTMLAFAAFVHAWLRSRERQGVCWPVVAGLCVAFAFLTRPLTAVGLAGGFGLWTLHAGVRRMHGFDRRKLAAMVLAFAVGPVAMATYNAALTGDPFTSPYGLYTARHTPSHVYGLHNRSRGRAADAPERLVAYDDWASTELTLPRAIDLVGVRWLALLRVGPGWVLTVMLAPFVLWAARRGSPLTLLAVSVAGLTLAYFPFAFPGIMDCSYILEGVPSLCVLIGVAVGVAATHWRRRGRPLLAAWWLGGVVLTLALNLATLPSDFADGSPYVFPRRRWQAIREQERRLAAGRPILVFVDARPRDDLASSPVVNLPTLDGSVVRVWDRPETNAAVRRRYPDRPAWRLDPGDFTRPAQFQQLP